MSEGSRHTDPSGGAARRGGGGGCGGGSSGVWAPGRNQQHWQKLLLPHCDGGIKPHALKSGV